MMSDDAAPRIMLLDDEPFMLKLIGRPMPAADLPGWCASWEQRRKGLFA